MKLLIKQFTPRSPSTSSLLGSNNVLSTLNLRSNLNVRHQLSCH